MSPVEVLGPKGPAPFGGVEMVTWARRQLEIASEIIDNPGGGLLFATQAIGQVKAALSEADPDRWEDVIQLLERAEDHGVRRRYDGARELIGQARNNLSPAG